MAATLATLKSYAKRAGRFLGLVDRPSGDQTSAVVADWFDTLAWKDVRSSRALRTLAGHLQERYDYVDDLLQDLFTAAYRAAPVLREPVEMDPSRLPNRQILAGILDSPEFVHLHPDTVGDAHAAAMAVLAVGGKLRALLEKARAAAAAAQAQAKAQERLERAVDAVVSSLQSAAAAARPDGSVPAARGRTVDTRLEAAKEAEQVRDQCAAQAEAQLAEVAPTLRRLARAALADAVVDARATTELMAAWGVEPGNADRMDPTARMELAERLSGSSSPGRPGRVGRGGGGPAGVAGGRWARSGHCGFEGR